MRLIGIGPRGARYNDVTLDLSGVGRSIPARSLLDAPVRQPSPYTLLMLENGGGKSVLLKLIFSVVLPGRRRIVGGGTLDNFVLPGDTGHVALEWMHVATGERLVTAKVFQHRARTASNASPLAETWYSFRPTDDVGLNSLPAVKDTRRLRTDGYKDAMETALKAVPAAQLTWLGDDQGRWRQHLRSVGIEPDLFDIQRSMNVDEGDAANAFTFSSAKGFIDWLLRTVTDPADATSVAETFGEWASLVADREQMLLEASFLEGAIAGLGPLAEAYAEHQSTERAAKGAGEGARVLARTITARADVEREQTRQLAEELDLAGTLVQERTTGRDRARDRLNEVRLATLRLELIEVHEQSKTLQGEVEEADRHLGAWELVPTVHDAGKAQQEAITLAGQVTAQDKTAAPALDRRDRAAAQLLSRLDAEAEAADRAATDADKQAASHDQVATVADAALGEQRERSGQVTQRIQTAQELVRQAEEATSAAAAAGLVPHRTKPQMVPALLTQAEKDAEARVSDFRRAKESLTAAGRARDNEIKHRPPLEETRTRAAKAASHAESALEAIHRDGRRIAQLERVLAIASTDETSYADSPALTVADLDACADSVAEVLRDDRRSHADALDDLRRDQTDDQRVLEALGDGGLLPVRTEVEGVLVTLRQAGVPAYSGWAYLAETVVANNRAALVAAHPALVDGIIVTDPTVLPRAQELLAQARLLPPAAIEVGPGRALLTGTPSGLANEAGEGNGSFVVEASPAMYDQDAAEVRRREIVAGMETRAVAIQDVTSQFTAVDSALSDLASWRRNYPAGTLQRLTDDDEQARSAVTAAIDALRQLDASITELQERFATARGLLDDANDREREASDRARDLHTLTAKVNVARQAEIELPSLRAELQSIKDTTEDLRRQRDTHQENARDARTQAQQHRSLAGTNRAEAGEVPASTRARAATVPDEPLPHLRQLARATHDAYLAVAADQDLRARAESAATHAKELDQQLALRDGDAVILARTLLGSAVGANRSSWETQTTNARVRLARLRERLQASDKAVGRLDEAIRAALPREADRKVWIILEPQWRPTSVEHGKELARTCEERQREAQIELENAVSHVTALEDTKNRAGQAEQDFRNIYATLRAVLNLAADASTEQDLEPYPGEATDASAEAEKTVQDLHHTAQALEKASGLLRRAAAELNDFVTLPEFEAMTNPVRRAITGSSQDQLGSRAAPMGRAARGPARHLETRPGERQHTPQGHRRSARRAGHGCLEDAAERVAAIQASRGPRRLGRPDLPAHHLQRARPDHGDVAGGRCRRQSGG
jgi:hypothetical protein